jgi:hypothetical protein
MKKLFKSKESMDYVPLVKDQQEYEEDTLRLIDEKDIAAAASDMQKYMQKHMAESHVINTPHYMGIQVTPATRPLTLPLTEADVRHIVRIEYDKFNEAVLQGNLDKLCESFRDVVKNLMVTVETLQEQVDEIWEELREQD